MARLTKQTPAGAWLPADALAPEDGGYTGPAAERLSAFEDYLESLRAEQELLSEKLEKLRAAGKKQTAQFREAMGEKLVGSNALLMLKMRGLE